MKNFGKVLTEVLLVVPISNPLDGKVAAVAYLFIENSLLLLVINTMITFLETNC